MRHELASTLSRAVSGSSLFRLWSPVELRPSPVGAHSFTTNRATVIELFFFGCTLKLWPNFMVRLNRSGEVKCRCVRLWAIRSEITTTSWWQLFVCTWFRRRRALRIHTALCVCACVCLWMMRGFKQIGLLALHLLRQAKKQTTSGS